MGIYFSEFIGGLAGADRGLAGADKGEGGHVFVAVGFGEEFLLPGELFEGLGLLEDGLAEAGGGGVVGIRYDLEDAAGAELGTVVGGVGDSLGDDEEGRPGFDGLHGRLVGEVGEEAERHGCVGEGGGCLRGRGG